MAADQDPPATQQKPSLLSEALTWRILLHRFRHAENRPLAAWNLSRHALRAIRGRACRAAHLLRIAAHEGRVLARIGLAYPRGFLRSPHQVVEQIAGQGRPLGPEVVVFVHFDAAGAVVETTRAFIRGLAAAGLPIAFVTNSGQLAEEARVFLAQHCAAILIRRNIGYDFGAWRDALDTLGLPRTETRAIYMMNDSMFGPFADLRPLLDAIDFDKADLWGATESWQHHYHLQSFFLACGPRVIRSPQWSAFWRSVRPVPCKDWIIRHCEIGFTRALAQGGIRAAALYPTRACLLDGAEQARLLALIEADAAQGGSDPHLRREAEHAWRVLRALRREEVGLNPSVDLWRQLLRAGYPFLKRELLMRNPTKVPDVFAWEEEVRRNLAADVGPLAAEIRGQLGDRLPAVWEPALPERPEARLSPAAS
ncbi:rhamnan synthesis F family protein [Acidisoma sp. C75]